MWWTNPHSKQLQLWSRPKVQKQEDMESSTTTQMWTNKKGSCLVCMLHKQQSETIDVWSKEEKRQQRYSFAKRSTNVSEFVKYVWLGKVLDIGDADITLLEMNLSIRSTERKFCWWSLGLCWSPAEEWGCSATECPMEWRQSAVAYC